MFEINLKIPELRNMLKEVQCITGINYSQYAFSFIKRRTELFMMSNKVISDTDFIYKINKSPGFAGQFLETVFVPNSELFRDPEMWNFLESKLLPKFSGKKNIKILLPYSTGAKELYSLLYILNKNPDKSNIEITVSSVTDVHLKQIKSGKFTDNDIKVSVKNIELLNSARDSDDVFYHKDISYSVKNDFNGQLNFEVCNFFDSKYLSDFDIVICRNSLIYFNTELQEKAIKTITRSLKKGGYLIIGASEIIGETGKRKYKQISKGLSIFKKKSIS